MTEGYTSMREAIVKGCVRLQVGGVTPAFKHHGRRTGACVLTPIGPKEKSMFL